MQHIKKIKFVTSEAQIQMWERGFRLLQSYRGKDVIIRLTADNCFPDKNLVEKLLKKINKDINYIYIDNVFQSSYGLSVEIFKLGYLRGKKIRSKELEHIL